MRRSLRSLGVMIATTFRASPGLATGVFALTALSYAAIPLRALGAKGLVDAAVRGDIHSIVAWGLASAVFMAASHLGLTLGVGTMRMNMEERTRLYIESRIVRLAGGVPGIEHHERPEYADEIELLRGGQGQLAQPAGPVIFLFGSLIWSSSAFVLLARLDPVLLFLPLLGVPTLIASGQATRVIRKAYEATVERQRLNAVLFNLSTSPGPGKETRIFGLGPELQRRLKKTQDDVTSELTVAGIKGDVMESAAWALFSIGYIGAVVLVAFRAARGESTPGDVFLVLVLAAQINSLVTQAASMISWLGTLLRVVRRYVWLMDYARDARVVLDDPADVPERLERGIELENVTFTYPAADQPALTDVSLRIPAGTTIAVVGDNGAGKSTFVKLLCRFYQPDEGRIVVDGVDLRRFEPEDWRSRLSAGFQDFAQFHFRARVSVGIGDIGRIDEEAVVAAALDRAHASDVLASLPDGLETQLGREFDDGFELSVGQWQKIALGRAMMRTEPLLLVLDEPTASLDAPTEHALFERYASGARRVAQATGAITVLVSHRFSTVRMADLIVVFDGGRITELGTHAELMARRGTYAELYDLQASAYR